MNYKEAYKVFRAIKESILFQLWEHKENYYEQVEEENVLKDGSNKRYWLGLIKGDLGKRLVEYNELELLEEYLDCDFVQNGEEGEPEYETTTIARLILPSIKRYY